MPPFFVVVLLFAKKRNLYLQQKNSRPESRVFVKQYERNITDLQHLSGRIG